MPRSERRNRRGQRSGGSSNRNADSSVLEAAAAISALSISVEGHGEAMLPDSNGSEPGPHGISILTEIFPEHAKSDSKDQQGRTLIHDLMNIPTPNRQRNAMQLEERPCSNGMAAPPAPPLLPASLCRQAPWEITPAPSAPAPMVTPSGHLTPSAPMVAPATPPPPQGFASYRERLRAGGQQAFQRAIDAGLVPKTMKQEWRPPVGGSAPPPPPAQCASQCMSTQCGVQPSMMPQAAMQDCSAATQPGALAACGDSQAMWNWSVEQQQQQPQFPVGATGSSATGPQCWTSNVSPPQMPPQMPPVMQMPQMPPQVTSPMAAAPQPNQQMLPQTAFQAPSQMLAGPGATAPVPQPPQGVAPQVVQTQMMQVPMPQTPTAESHADFDRCMAIAMPGFQADHYNKEFIAAQLKAAALTPYED
mmetsp:Transcript_67867/g.120554  ORF Transcript_67867/g.120554 Transcript_67867/m.120554 type:complete len:418 (-) Transcript_67867:128-1381(-)